MRHLIDPLDFTQQEISTLLDLADRIHDDPAAYQEVARHKKLATLVYEPSSRITGWRLAPPPPPASPLRQPC